MLEYCPKPLPRLLSPFHRTRLLKWLENGRDVVDNGIAELKRFLELWVLRCCRRSLDGKENGGNGA